MLESLLGFLHGQLIKYLAAIESSTSFQSTQSATRRIFKTVNGKVIRKDLEIRTQDGNVNKKKRSKLIRNKYPKAFIT